MTKNPYVNAFVALFYIIAVVLFIKLGGHFASTTDSLIAPVAALSLLVLSAAFMAYTFFLNPVLMYLDGQKREAVELFTRTLLSFAAVTAVILIIAFFFA